MHRTCGLVTLLEMFLLRQVVNCIAKASHGDYVVRESEKVAGAFTLVVKAYVHVPVRACSVRGVRVHASFKTLVTW